MNKKSTCGHQGMQMQSPSLGNVTRFRVFLVCTVALAALGLMACSEAPDDSADDSDTSYQPKPGGHGASAGGGAAPSADGSAGAPGGGAGTPGVPDIGECAGKPRVGDPESVYDASLDDPRYPMMKAWATAGVTGGIPKADNVAAELGPSDGLVAIQAAIDSAAVSVKNDVRPETFKVIKLKKGRYEINGGELNPILVVKSGVILRGESRDETILAFTTARNGAEYDFSIGLKAWSGLESVTVTNQYVETLDESTYVGKFENVLTNDVGAKLSGVTLQGNNSWVQGTRISKIGTHPVFIGNRHHCTLRDNIVEKSLNKGGGGRGYYYIADKASYNLIYHEYIADLRHFTYLLGVNHNVVLNVTAKVDLNFHNKPQMVNNLFEGVRSEIPHSHRWGKGSSWGFGWYTVDVTKEDHNVAYKMSTLPDYPDTKAYLVLRNYTTKPDGHAFLEIPSPRAGTFYPVTGCREPPPSP